MSSRPPFYVTDPDGSSEECVVYFVQADRGGPVKIGTSRRGILDSRVKALQTGCPHPLVVRRIVRGDAREERALHDHFARYRLSGEWFAPAPDLAELCGAIPINDVEALALVSAEEEGYRRGHSDGYSEGELDYAKSVGRAFGRMLLQEPEVREVVIAFLADEVPGEMKQAIDGEVREWVRT